MRRSNFFILFLLGVIAISFARAQLFRRTSEFAGFYGTKVAVSGLVVADPEEKNGRQNLVIRPEGYRQDILITVFSGRKYSYGDRMYVNGKITEPKPFADFDYPNYLAAKNIYAQMFLPAVFVLATRQGNPVIYYALGFKHYLFEQILKVLPQPRSGLLISLVSGNKNYLPVQTAESFNSTGTAHVIAVSGFKLTLVFIALDSLAAFLGRKSVLALAALFAIVYLIMADFAAPVWRAIIMSGLFLLSKEFGRQYRILPALLLTAAVLLLTNPLIIKNDIGFILSFTGIAGIIYFGPLFALLFRRLPAKFGLKEVLVSSLAAQTATAPVMIYFFHQFSFFSPLTNVLTVPLLSPSILLGYLCAAPGLNRIVAVLLALPLNFMLIVVKYFAGLSFGAIQPRLNPAGLFWAYVAEIAGYLLIKFILKKARVFDKI